MSLEISKASLAKAQGAELRQELLTRVNTENIQLLERLKVTGSQPIEQVTELVAAIDRILGDGDWEDSLFLRNTAKPLIQLREQANQLLQQHSGRHAEANVSAPVLSEEMQPVYVLLYQNQGHNLESWAQLLRSIDKYALGRPVYANEADVKKVIRHKMSQQQDAYVVVAVKREILQRDTLFGGRMDRHGNALVDVPVGAMKASQIIEFVHAGKRYYFNKGELVDVSSTTKRH